MRNDILDANPVMGYIKPAARSRTRIVTPDEFQVLLRGAASNPPFRRVLIALRQTGCRPKEIRSLTWDMVDLKEGFWILPKHKTITTQRHPRPRFIPLPPVVWALCRWLDRRGRSASGHVFVNMHGAPYSKDTLVRLMDRLRKRSGMTAVAGEQIVLYSHRHTFGTESVGKVSDIELAELMGHTTTQTTKRYVHLNASRLREIQRRLHG